MAFMPEIYALLPDELRIIKFMYTQVNTIVFPSLNVIIAGQINSGIVRMLTSI